MTTPVDNGEDSVASCLPAVASPPVVDLSAIQMPVPRYVTNADYDILAVAVAEAGIPTQVIVRPSHNNLFSARLVLINLRPNRQSRAREDTIARAFLVLDATA